MLQKVKTLLAKQLEMKVEDIADDMNIIEDLGADSLQIVEMLMTIEEKFNIVVPDEDVPELKTVKSVAAYIESKI
ncbi:MAG: acyl carrier protein [Ruminococcaceae bacterium]|nr:acyl carrier protein [Oscillospiraceae bacterium]